MDYQEVTFDLTGSEEFVSDILAAQLGEIGFESFVQENSFLLCYCPENVFDEKTMLSALASSPVELPNPLKIKLVAQENWNKTWEENSFQPIEIDSRCVIHSPKKTVEKFEYDILIDPHLAFGTGYHDTTNLLISCMLQMNFAQKNILDMGCGTGVLGILASKMGAKKVTAIDIDEFSYKNTILNTQLNGIENLEAFLGDAELLRENHKSGEFDVIFANINRNILLRDMPKYCAVLAKNGTLILSGFFFSDAEILRREAAKNSLTELFCREKNSWTVLCFAKK